MIFFIIIPGQPKPQPFTTICIAGFNFTATSQVVMTIAIQISQKIRFSLYLETVTQSLIDVDVTEIRKQLEKCQKLEACDKLEVTSTAAITAFFRLLKT